MIHQVAKSPVLSIVIPLYYSEKTIGEVLNSIYHLLYDKKKIELILIYYSNGDNSIYVLNDFIKKYGSSFYDIKIIPREDKRANFARNVGIKRSEGDYIFLLNDDIILPPETLKNFEKIFSTDLRVAAITFPFIFKPPRLREQIMFFKFLGKVKYTKVFGLGCSIVKKKVLEEVGLINEQLGPPSTSNDDYEVSARVAKAHYKTIMDGTIIVSDIGEEKPYQERSKGALETLQKYIIYDFTIGADTFYLVLKSAPLSWIFENLLYFALPIIFLSLLLNQVLLAFIYLGVLIALISIYYQSSSIRGVVYSCVIIARRIFRIYSCFLKKIYMVVLKVKDIWM